VIFLALFGCKEQSDPAPDSKESLNGQKSFNPYAGITVQHGMLRFQNSVHLLQVLNQLDSEKELWNDNFQATWGSLDDDAYNAKAEQLNFDEDQPLKNFESQFSLSSLRNKIYVEEDAWLDNTTLDPNTDPKSNTTIDGEIFQSVFNAQGEMRIGDSIYVEKPYIDVLRTVGGSPNTKALILIPNGDITVLNQIRAKSFLTGADFTSSRGRVGAFYNKAKPVTDNYDKSASGCKGHKRSFDEFPYDNGNKRYYVETKIRNYFIWSNVAAQTVSYKKRDNGKWRRWKTSIGVTIAGDVSNYDCTITGPFSTKEKLDKKRKSVSVRIVNFFIIVKAKNPYDVYSNHFCNGQSQVWGIWW
jgi:hypothetical protein